MALGTITHARARAVERKVITSGSADRRAWSCVLRVYVLYTYIVCSLGRSGRVDTNR